MEGGNVWNLKNLKKKLIKRKFRKEISMDGKIKYKMKNIKRIFWKYNKHNKKKVFISFFFFSF